MHYTNFKSKEKFQFEIAKESERLLEIINNIELAFDKDLHPKNKNSYQMLVELFSPDTRIQKTLHSCLATIMQKGEILSAGSSNISFLFSLYFIKELLKYQKLLNTNEVELSSLFEETLEKIRNLISFNSKTISKEKLHKEIEKICNNKSLSNSLKEALDLAGLEGKIHVEDSQQSNYLVELKNGYNFRLNPYKFFLEDDKWQETNVKMLIIDGVIENISEMNNLLNKTLETKIPMVIVAHGFSEEVIATLKTNRDHKILNIMPIRLFSDLESINVVNDIGIACGGDIISSHKGEQIQFINYDLLPVVDRVICTSKEFIIENNKSLKVVSSHIRSLLKKREEVKAVEDLSNLIDKRIKSLFTHTVVINLPNYAVNKKTELKTKIDTSLRMCKTLLTYGFIDFNKFINDLENKKSTKTDKIILSVLEKIKLEENEIPTLSLYIGIYFSVKMILPLMMSKGFVEKIN